jgi:K+-transporting ATPase KdpF subunit
MKGAIRWVAPFVLSDSRRTTGVKIDDGHSSTRHSNRIFRSVLCLHQSLRPALTGGSAMILDYILSGAVTVFLTVYLTYALIRPERF